MIIHGACICEHPLNLIEILTFQLSFWGYEHRSAQAQPSLPHLSSESNVHPGWRRVKSLKRGDLRSYTAESQSHLLKIGSAYRPVDGPLNCMQAVILAWPVAPIDLSNGIPMFCRGDSDPGCNRRTGVRVLQRISTTLTYTSFRALLVSRSATDPTCSY